MELFCANFRHTNHHETTRFCLSDPAGITPAFAVGTEPTRTIARAEVNFFEPEKFTDVATVTWGTLHGTYLDHFRDYIIEQAPLLRAPGPHLA